MKPRGCHSTTSTVQMWCVDVQHNGMVINRYHISASKWDVSYNRDAQQVAVAVFEQWTPVVTDSRDQKENDRKSQKKRFQKTHEFLFVLWFHLFVVTAFVPFLLNHLRFCSLDLHTCGFSLDCRM